MGLKLEWEWNGGHGVATAGGLRLVVRNCYHPVTWQIRSGPWGEDSHEVEVIDDDWRAATLAAQEAAEAAAARMLADDAGVRALVSLIGDALTDTPADEPMRGLVDFIAVHVERDALRAKVAELEASMRWIPVTEGLPPEGVEVLVSRARLDGVRYVRSRPWQPRPPSWVPPLWAPPPDAVPLGVWAGAMGWVPVNDDDHWRPLPAGPEVQP